MKRILALALALILAAGCLPVCSALADCIDRPVILHNDCGMYITAVRAVPFGWDEEREDLLPETLAPYGTEEFSVNLDTDYHEFALHFTLEDSLVLCYLLQDHEDPYGPLEMALRDKTDGWGLTVGDADNVEPYVIHALTEEYEEEEWADPKLYPSWINPSEVLQLVDPSVKKEPAEEPAEEEPAEEPAEEEPAEEELVEEPEEEEPEEEPAEEEPAEEPGEEEPEEEPAATPKPEKKPASLKKRKTAETNRKTYRNVRVLIQNDLTDDIVAVYMKPHRRASWSGNMLKANHYIPIGKTVTLQGTITYTTDSAWDLYINTRGGGYFRSTDFRFGHLKTPKKVHIRVSSDGRGKYWKKIW